MLSQIRPAIVSTILFTLLLGVAYPLAVTGIGKLAFPFQAEGSLLKDSRGQVIGSALIGQGFGKPEYLHPRPSAAGNGWDASNSSGSNYGPLSADLAKRVKGDAEALRASTGHQEIPDDAITTSGSGLDPDISPAYALLQADRIAAARHAPAALVRDEIARHVDPPFLGFIGQPRVNVLATNLALDARLPLAPAPRKT
jgi:K+-transporting ATPase ATPase C chain